MKIEVTAVNTAGLWYAMVLLDGKVIYQSKTGYPSREDAVREGEEWSNQPPEFFQVLVGRK